MENYKYKIGERVLFNFDNNKKAQEGQVFVTGYQKILDYRLPNGKDALVIKEIKKFIGSIFYNCDYINKKGNRDNFDFYEFELLPPDREIKLDL